MRMPYTPASEQTINILSRDRKGIAAEMDVVPNHIDQIIAGNANDPFLMFKRMYAASVRRGISVAEWDAEFSSIKANYRSNAANALANEIRASSELHVAIVEAESDGVIDELERRRILRAAAVERDALDTIEASYAAGEIRDFARKAVFDRTGTAR